jgi:hypothetical protein
MKLTHQRSPPWISLIFLLIALLGMRDASGQSPLPVIEGVDAQTLRLQCRQLLDVLAKTKASLPKETEPELRDLVTDDKKAGDEAAGEKIQKLLNTQCLVAVSINPESRVKAARGPRSAELVVGKESVFLIRLLNEAGVTHPLSVESPQMRKPSESSKEKWLEASICSVPFRDLRMEKEGSRTEQEEPKLSGQKLEYLLLRLRAHETGKREATLVFDVGQGTQDLGFRAEVPILFTIKEKWVLISIWTGGNRENSGRIAGSISSSFLSLC